MVIRLLGGRAGGAERLFIDTANMFAEDGYEVTVVYCDPSQAPPPYPLLPKVARVNLYAKTPRMAPWYRALDALAQVKVPLFAPADWLAKNLYFVRRLHRVAKDAKPDVIISFLPPANTPSLLAGAMARVKVIPTNHSVPQHDYESKIRWDQNPIDRALRFWSLHAAEKIHVLFPSYADWFPERIRRKVVAIPNYVSDEFASLAPVPREKVILAVGRLGDIKNYPMLVDAWSLLAARFPEWKVRIYGAGPQRRLLDKRIRDLALSGQVELMGQETNIKPIYLGSEIFCHPALFEGFGLSVAEALACGLPVVAFSDSAGVTEMVRDEVNGLLVPRRRGAAGLADALSRLIVDAPLRLAMRARAPDSIRSFDKGSFHERWTQVLEEVM